MAEMSTDRRNVGDNGGETSVSCASDTNVYNSCGTIINC